MPEKIPAVPQTWVAEQELSVGANGDTPRDEHTDAALSTYLRSLVHLRGIKWVHGGGVGGYDRDVYAIMTQKLIPEDLPGCSDSCSLTAEIDEGDAFVIRCKVGGFATKKAAEDQERACAACQDDTANIIAANIMNVNSKVQTAIRALDEEERRHAETTRQLNSKLSRLL